MPKSRIMIQLEDGDIKLIDEVRGDTPRAAWIRRACEDRLRGSSVSAEWSRPIPPSPNDLDWEADQASVSQKEEHRSPKPGDERSNRSRRAGKGSPSAGSVGVQGDKPGPPTDGKASAQGSSRPIKKGKACKHTNQIRKLGAAFCTDCGEFV